MNKFFWFILFIFSQVVGFAQSDTLIQDGKYFNANIFIYNPEEGQGYSIQKIIINNDTLTNDLATNGIEIDFTTFELKEEDPIRIRIVYMGDEPSIVNPEALAGQQNFRFSRPKFFKGDLQWRISGDPSDYPIEIEQYKWGEWRTVGEVDPLDTVKNNLYQYQMLLHSGPNRIRLKTTNISGQKVMSKEVRYTPARMGAVQIESTKIKEEIIFSRETEYEIYDIDGTLIKRGVERYVDAKDLAKGEYWLNYDNKTIQIKKK